MSFNGVTVTSWTVNSATGVTFVMPAGASTGKLTIVTTGGSVTYNTNVTIY
jgi:hypothetical protein